MSDFNFQQAQEYEFKYAQSWIDKHGEQVMADVDRLRNGNIVEPHYLELFFQNKTELWDKFHAHVKDKNCLEISSGPCGVFPLWAHWIKREKIAIDPLLVRYQVYLKEKFNRSWFTEDTELFPTGAENFLPELENKIDGFILWRNGIDHFLEWRQALNNLTRYAKPGCQLLFWGDLIHIEAPDEGHCEKVVGSIPEFEAILRDLGWEIQYTSPAQRDHKNIIDYGCVAVKAGKIEKSSEAKDLPGKGITYENEASSAVKSPASIMRKDELIGFLGRCNDAEISFLYKCLDYASDLKKAMLRYGIEPEELAYTLGIDMEQCQAILKGAYVYTVEEFAKIDDMLYKKSLQQKMKEAHKESLISPE